MWKHFCSVWAQWDILSLGLCRSKQMFPGLTSYRQDLQKHFNPALFSPYHSQSFLCHSLYGYGRPRCLVWTRWSRRSFPALMIPWFSVHSCVGVLHCPHFSYAASSPASFVAHLGPCAAVFLHSPHSSTWVGCSSWACLCSKPAPGIIIIMIYCLALRFFP